MIFDPRIQRFLVTTINEQSVRGTSLVLEQIGRVAPPEADIDNEKYYDPSLVISMLTPEVKLLSAFKDALVAFESAYVQPQQDNLNSTSLEIKETYLAQELLYVNNWEDARSKLNPTSVMKIAMEWAEEQLRITTSQESKSEFTKQIDKIAEVRKLRNVCQQYEYAEQGRGEDLLVTEPLKHLATTFRDELPHVVSIGAKGAGKTFNYIQLSRFKYWERFLNYIDNTEPELNPEIYIFPYFNHEMLRIMRQLSLTVDKAKEVQFEKWTASRLLPPQAIRRALEPCSKKKVDEAKEEYPAFKAWVEDILPKYSADERKIPFAVEQFEMDQQTVRMLEEMGVIYEDKEKDDTARFYMPEIFREGLGFSGKGARPRILVLKRKALGKGIV